MIMVWSLVTRHYWSIPWSPLINQWTDIRDKLSVILQTITSQWTVIETREIWDWNKDISWNKCTNVVEACMAACAQEKLIPGVFLQTNSFQTNTTEYVSFSTLISNQQKYFLCSFKASCWYESLLGCCLELVNWKWLETKLQIFAIMILLELAECQHRNNKWVHNESKLSYNFW